MCNRLAYALYLRGDIEAKKLVLQRRLAERHARYRLQHEGEFKTMKTLEASMLLSDPIRQITRKISALEVREVALDAVIKGYEHIARAASREMSRRGIERENTSRD